MNLLVYARAALIDRRLGVDQPALLLEGSWPAGTPSGRRWSLDDAIDGRFQWIDRKAGDWAEQLAATAQPGDDNDRPPDNLSAAYLNALALRYYLVKLIRLSAYFAEVRPWQPADRVELIAAAPRDDDYAELLSQCARAIGAGYRVRRVQHEIGAQNRTAGNALWRRWMARLCDCLHPAPDCSGSRRRVVLSGNPRLLDPVCRELLSTHCDTWWLYDRFAVKSWAHWQSAGVGQLVCNSSLGSANRLTVDVPDRLECYGLNLAGPIRRWFEARTATHGPAQTRLVEQIDAHFRRIRPEALVLAEDATPMARAAVAVGRRYGVRSLVVQHGVPGCRFGFAPLCADRILAWGESSQQRLTEWGVSPERIRITGSPQADRLRGELGGMQRPHKPTSPRILLLATVPPRDERPDAVALHLTRRTYSEMLRTAFAAVAKIAGAELIVKLHPRSPDDPVARAQRATFPSLRCRMVREGPIQKWLRGADCVLSCLSTAGIEATLAGVPVIQLAPPGISDALPDDQWGLAGTARCEAELDRLLAVALAEGRHATPNSNPIALAIFGQPAATRIAREVLARDVDFRGPRVDEARHGRLVTT